MASTPRRSTVTAKAATLPETPTIREARELAAEIAQLTERIERLKTRREHLAFTLRGVDGLSWTSIAGLLHVSPQRVYQWVAARERASAESLRPARSPSPAAPAAVEDTPA